MSDPVGFVTGAALTAVGAGLTFFGAGAVGGPLMALGIGQMSQGLFGIRDHQEGAQLNVTSNQAPLPVAYGRQKLG